MSTVNTVVYYTLQHVGSLGVYPLPIHTAAEKAQAEALALQTVVLNWGDLRIVLFVTEDIDDVIIHLWLNYLQRGEDGNEPNFSTSRYWEDGSGEGHVDDE
jgi:hypothetical protein